MPSRKRPNSYEKYKPSIAETNGLYKEVLPVSSKMEGCFKSFFNRTFVPLTLMTVCPNLVIILWYTASKCQGSYAILMQKLSDGGLVNGMIKMWSDIHIASELVAYILLGYIAWALLLMKILPGPSGQGPVTSKGHIPQYTDNGFKCYIVTMVSFCIMTVILKLNGYTPTIIYDHFDEFLGTLTIFSHLLCIFLHFKGLVFPSSTDSGTTGNLIFDYYWGTELYPRVFGIDIKVFTNCRFGMTVWPLLVLIFAIKSYELHGFVDSMCVSAILQLIYITKFFWWESGYMRTIDIMMDRAGFYICWGCLVFIPGFYCSVSMYLVNQPVHLGYFWSAVIVVCGAACIAINYLADKQKQDVRRTNGNCLIWGKKPEVISATYVLESGEVKESMLLVSGYWKIARHFHYIPELLLVFFWSLPGLFHNIMVYSYAIFLVFLLVHRTFRDDTKCAEKYKTYWVEYCRRVPYKMIPGLF